MGWKDAPEVDAPAWASAPEVESPSIGKRALQQAGNFVAGAVRGAGSIGATILVPIDMAMDAIDPRQKLSDLVTGQKPMSRNEERRQKMTEALGDLGADTGSLAFGAGKLAGEVAGTAGAGGAVANVAARVPGVAAAAPNLLQAIRTAGMSAGSATGPANALIRAAGGGIAGGAGAGLVDPQEAEAGALVGAALPGVVKVAGMAGNKIGQILRGAEQSPELATAIQAARSAGYVIPPTQARPTLGNRVLEGFSGKLTTAQNASAKNQAVTNKLAAEAIGLPGDTQITADVLEQVRSDAGKAYEALKSLPVKPAQAANTLTNTPASPAINPREMVFDLRKARNDASAWFKSYGRTADPDSLAKAQAAASKAAALESTLESYASSLGMNDLVQSMREARTLIAKTYSIEDALNATTGSVDARKLAKQLNNGKPLSDELKQAAEFAARFPKAAQTVEGMGSLPQSSPLDWALGGSLAATTANPLALGAVAARPAARALVLSPVIQNRLIQSQGNAIAALANPQLVQLGYRAAPVLAADQ